MATFDTVAATFWEPTDREPLTPDRVAAVERTLGVTLPATLLDLLRRQNGGPVADAWDAYPTDPGDYVPFEHLHGVGPDALTLADTPYLLREWGLPSDVVLLSGDGHTWIALDYRTCGPAGEPPVIWLDADRNRELPLARDFRSFVERLMPTPP